MERIYIYIQLNPAQDPNTRLAHISCRYSILIGERYIRHTRDHRSTHNGSRKSKPAVQVVSRAQAAIPERESPSCARSRQRSEIHRVQVATINCSTTPPTFKKE